EGFLAVEHLRRRLDNKPLRLDRRSLDNGVAKIAAEHLQAARRLEGPGIGRKHLFVGALAQCRLAKHRAIFSELWLNRIGAQSLSPYGLHVFVQKSGVEQFSDQETHAPRRMEMVHVSQAV